MAYAGPTSVPRSDLIPDELQTFDDLTKTLPDPARAYHVRDFDELAKALPPVAAYPHADQVAQFDAMSGKLPGLAVGGPDLDAPSSHSPAVANALGFLDSLSAQDAQETPPVPGMPQGTAQGLGGPPAATGAPFGSADAGSVPPPAPAPVPEPPPEAVAGGGTAAFVSLAGPAPETPEVPAPEPPPAPAKSPVHAVLDRLGDVLTGMVRGAPQAAEDVGQAAAGGVSAVPALTVDPLAGLGGSGARVRLPGGAEAVDWLRTQGQEQLGGPVQQAERAAFGKMAAGEPVTPAEERAVTEGPSAQFGMGMAGGPGPSAAEDLAAGINALQKAGIPRSLAERAAVAPPSNQLWGQFWKRARTFIADQGEAGKELAGKVHEWREVAETTAGDWTSRLPTVRQLKPAAFANFVDVAEGKAEPLNATIARAAEEWSNVRSEVWQRAKDAGMDVGRLENYFPHQFEDAVFTGDGWRKSIDHLVASGQAATEVEAATILRNLPNVVRNRRYGNLEAAREVDLPFYKKSADVLFGQGGYLEHAADRIAQVETFGKGDEEALKLITRIGDEGGNAGAARNAFDVSVGARKYEPALQQLTGAARRLNTVTQLGLSALSNATQPINTAIVAGFGRTGRNTLLALRSPEAREYAVKAGVVGDRVVQDIAEGTGLASRALARVTAPGFATVEGLNRVLTFHTGIEYASDMAARAAAGDARARVGLERLNLDPARIVAQQGLTEADEIRAGRAMVERTQFKVGGQDLPYWTDHPLGKLVFQFKSFSYNQTAFMKREILDPLVTEGNPAPLVRFMIAGYLAGAAQTELKNRLQQRESEQDPVKRTIQYYNAVGGLGLVGDVARVAGGITNVNADRLPADRVVSQAVGTALGPTMGRVTDVLGGVAQAARGNPTQLERVALRSVPVVGTTLQNIFLPYEKRAEPFALPGAPPKPPRAPSPPKPPRPGGR